MEYNKVNNIHFIGGYMTIVVCRSTFQQEIYFHYWYHTLICSKYEY
jgi:hypothetical protein